MRADCWYYNLQIRTSCVWWLCKLLEHLEGRSLLALPRVRSRRRLPAGAARTGAGSAPGGSDPGVPNSGRWWSSAGALLPGSGGGWEEPLRAWVCVPEASSCVWPVQDLEDLETDEETDLEEGDEEDEQKIQKDEL